MKQLTPWENDLRNRLASHKATPPIMGWNKLQQQLCTSTKVSSSAHQKQNSPTKRVNRKWIVAFSTVFTAAASIALIFLLFTPKKIVNPLPIEEFATKPSTPTPQHFSSLSQKKKKNLCLLGNLQLGG